MTKIEWTLSKGNKVVVTYSATAKIVKDEIKLDGQPTGVYRSHLIETMDSVVTLDGKSLGKVEFIRATPNSAGVVYALNKTVGITEDKYNELIAAERAEKNKARELDEVRAYTEEQDKAKKKAEIVDEIYRDNNAKIMAAMNV